MQMTQSLPVPVIMISRRADTSAVIGGLRTGAIDYIRKPFDSEEVLARVGTILRFHLLDLKQRRSTARQVRPCCRRCAWPQGRPDCAHAKFINLTKHRAQRTSEALSWLTCCLQLAS